MKTPVAVTLIVMGVLLVMSPIAADYLYQRNVVEILNSTSASNVSLVGQLSEMYRLGCWATGTLMVAVAVAGSFIRGSCCEKSSPPQS